MKFFLVCNPGSYSGRSRSTIDLYKQLLRGSGVSFDSETTADLADAVPITQRAAEAGYKAVVAVGGDGTINRVVNGLMRAGGGCRCALGVLYSGTSPDFCRFHGLPTAPERAVDVLVMGKASPIDVCRMTYRDAADEHVTSYFVCSANIGLGAGIARRSNRIRRHLGDFLGTLLATLVSMGRAGRPALEITVDGETQRLESVMNVTLGKNPHLASGLKLDVDVSPADGRLYVFAVAGVGRLSMLAALPRVYSGRIVTDDRFILKWGRSVRVAANGYDVEVEFDGDPAGRCPVEAELVPDRLRLIGGGR